MQLPAEKVISKIKTVEVPTSLKLLCKKRVSELWAVYRAKGATVALPTISFDLRGKTAGRAYLTTNHIQLNAVLLIENSEEFLSTVIGHELAHLVAYALYRESGHGAKWAKCMEMIGLPAKRCHNMDTQNSTVVAQIEISCLCNRTYKISKRKLASLLASRLYCKVCLAVFEPVDPALKLEQALGVLATTPRAQPYRGSGGRFSTKQFQEGVPSGTGKSVGKVTRPVVLPVPTVKPKTEPPSSKQLSYINVLAAKHKVLIPGWATASKEGASRWISELLGSNA